MKKIFSGRGLLSVGVLGPFISLLILYWAINSSPYTGISMGPVLAPTPTSVVIISILSGLVFILGLIIFLIGWWSTRKGTWPDTTLKIIGTGIYLLAFAFIVILFGGTGGIVLTG